MRVTAIILAAGSGSRMKSDVTKQKMSLNGKSVLFRSVQAFEKSKYISDIVVTVRSDEVDFANEETKTFSKVRCIVIGGRTRFESAKFGFSSVNWSCDYVALHDGARCFITPDMIDSVCLDAEKYGAATASTSVTDTVKRIDADGNIKDTVDRQTLVCVQTPQIFEKNLYLKGINAADVEDLSITDDNMLMERIGVKVHCTDTGKRNIKITVPEDLFIAETMLRGEE